MAKDKDLALAHLTGAALPTVLTLPFTLRGHIGLVSVGYGVNADPAHWGFDLVEIPFPRANTRGFPVMAAGITFSRAGYAVLMGWLQVVTVESRDEAAVWIEPDVFPLHWESDSPFVSFGVTPALFDAPGPNPPRANERWTAHTVLAVAAGVARRREVTPVVGYTWGYDLADSRATPFAPRSAAADDWRRSQASLTTRYPAWQFLAPPAD